MGSRMVRSTHAKRKAIRSWRDVMHELLHMPLIRRRSRLCAEEHQLLLRELFFDVERQQLNERVGQDAPQHEHRRRLIQLAVDVVQRQACMQEGPLGISFPVIDPVVPHVLAPLGLARGRHGAGAAAARVRARSSPWELCPRD